MSPHAIAILVALTVPTIAIAVLRINAAMMFLSVCLGAVLVQYVGPQANELIRLFVPRAGSVSASTLNLILLLAPVAMTGVVTVFSVHGRMRVLVNLLPAVACASLVVLLAVPMLPANVSFAFTDEKIWNILSKSEALVIGAGGVMSLFFLWTQRRNFRQHDKRRR